MDSITSSRFFVYVLARPDSTPFYVGKGKGRRLYFHEWEARTGHRCHKCSVIRKIWRSGGEVQRYIVLETDNEQEALDYERELIASYGRETLTNSTNGGEGVSGLRHSLESRAVMSAKQKARGAEPETRAKLRIAGKAAWANPAIRARFLALRQTPEYRSALGASLTPEMLERRAASIKASWESPEVREKRIAAQKAIWSDPDRHASLTAARSTPEARARWQALRSSPEYRKQQSEKQKAVWAARKAAKDGV